MFNPLSIPPSDGSLKSTDHRQGAENANRNLVDLIPIPKVNPTFPGANDEMMTGFSQRTTAKELDTYSGYLWLFMVSLSGYFGYALKCIVVVVRC